MTVTASVPPIPNVTVTVGTSPVVTVPALPGPRGPVGPVGTQGLYVQPEQPTADGPYLWIQTGLGDSGDGYTLWIEDGQP